MEILHILAKLTGLPHEAVVKDFLVTARELGIEPENMSLDDIKTVLAIKLDKGFPEAMEKLNNKLAH